MYYVLSEYNLCVCCTMLGKFLNNKLNIINYLNVVFLAHMFVTVIFILKIFIIQKNNKNNVFLNLS